VLNPARCYPGAMNVVDIPLNRFLGLQRDGSVLKLPGDARYLNHLGTVHASAQFALAEAASGQWLLGEFGATAAEYAAVVRRVEVKYRRPATGELTARADVPPEEVERFRDTLQRRGRAAIGVSVRVHGADNETTLEATFEWFAQRVRG
jgi:acyl-coenzyme A thioesterase PaaI-like protein